MMAAGASARRDRRSGHPVRSVFHALLERRSRVIRPCWRALNLLLACALAVFGTPLPPLPGWLPEPIRDAAESLAPQDAYASALKSIQRGSTSLSSNAESSTVTISQVDVQKSVIFVTMAPNSTAVENGLVTAEFFSPTQIYISRQSTSLPTTVEWTVVEFNGDTFVQSGLSIVNKDSAGRSVSLAVPVDLTKSFVVISMNSPAVASVTDTMISAGMTDANTLTLTRQATTGSVQVVVAWQVVEVQKDVQVQRGSTTVSTGSATATLSPALAATGKALLLFTTRAAGNNVNYATGTLTGEITDTSTLTFTRRTSQFSCIAEWFVLEFLDATTVQRGKVTGWTTASTSATPSAVDTGRSWVITSANTSATTAANNHMHTAALSGSTTVALTRSGTTSSDVAWQVVELPPIRLTAPNNGELWTAGSSQDITWKYSNQATTGGTCGGGAGPGHKLQIDLSKDAGGTWPMTITSDVCANLGTYPWTIPDTISATSVMGTTMRMRITDLDESTTTYDTSDADFEIRGTLSLGGPGDGPNGGEVWYIQDTNRYIDWSYTGAFGTVNLFYSTDSGSNWVSLQTDYSAGSGGSGSYNWNPVPNLPYTTMRVKVESTPAVNPENYTQVLIASAADFTIQPNITVVAPSDTDKWPLGRTRAIEWTSTGSGASFNIYYNVSGGAWQSLATSETGYTGGSCPGGSVCYDWDIANTTPVSEFAKVKIEWTGDTSVFDTGPDGGDGFFSIIPSLDITSPTNGTEVWKVGESHDITWDVYGESGVSQVDVFYSTDSSTATPTWTLVSGGDNFDVAGCTGSPAACSLPWTVPSALSNDVRIKIEDVVDSADVYDLSDNAFSVKGRMVITNPNATPPDDVLRVGSNYTIRWDVFGDIKNQACGSPPCNVDIALSKTGAPPYDVTVATGIDPQSGGSYGTYSWNNIPDQRTSTAKLKVFLPGDSDVADESEPFKLLGNLSGVFPSGGQTYGIGQSIPITWSASPNPWPSAPVKVLYSTNAGSTYPAANEITTCSEGNPVNADVQACTWTVPDIAGIVSDQFRVKVELVGDESNVFAQSGIFKVQGSATVTSPTSGQLVKVGTNTSINWTPQPSGGGLGTLKILYSQDGGSNYEATTIATGVNADSPPYDWLPTGAQLGDGVEQNTNFRLMLQSESNVFADSESSVFTLRGDLKSLNLSGGQTLFVGDAFNITWDTKDYVPSPLLNNVPLVDLHYSVNGGSTWTLVAASQSNVEAFDWGTVGGVPDAIGSSAKVRVRTSTVALQNDITTQSATTFTIKGKVNSVDRPNAALDTGNGAVIVGSPYVIRWTRTGSIGDVDIYFSTDGGGSWGSPIGTAPSADGNWSWPSVPDEIDIDNKIKVEDADDDTVQAVSDAFEIKGKVDLTQPNGGGVYNQGDPLEIQWTPTGTLGNLEILYSTDGGTSFTVIPGAESVAASAGSWSWTITQTPSQNYLIRLRSLASPAKFLDETSANTFTVLGDVTLTAPSDPISPPLKVGNSYAINWSSTGVNQVHLYYSTDGGSTFPNLITTGGAILATAKPYSWTVPNAIFGDVISVRIVDADFPSLVLDESDNTFEIVGTLELTVPDSSATCYVGQGCDIKWVPTGTFQNTVNLEYTLDGGTTWQA
ncbi:MAG TPA: hypothetical protein VGB20_01900, partial [bacterium]